MMLKQTIESPDRKAVFNPGGKNSVVQLGSYKEMVFHRDAEHKIAFEYQWDYGQPENQGPYLGEFVLWKHLVF